MRVVVIATILLASSSLCPSLAQEQGKPPVTAPQTVPAQPDQNSQQQRDQRTDRDQPRGDDREMGRDWRMRRGDDDRQGREDREMGPDRRMHRDRDDDRDRDKDPGRYRDRGRYSDRSDRDNRGWDRADRCRDYRGCYDEDRPRRRVKVCVEYENGDEYCRYKEGR
jgi:hypothetical protein